MVKYKLFMDKNVERKFKSPEQIEALERFYSEFMYPSEAMKAKLAVELMLSKEQVHKWFCHRRQKEKKLKKADPGLRSNPYANSNVKRDNGKKVKHLWLSRLKEGENRRLLSVEDYPNTIENTYVGISSSQEIYTSQNASPRETELIRTQFQSGNNCPGKSDRQLRKRRNPYCIESKRRKNRALDLDMEQNDLQGFGDNEDVRVAKTNLCVQNCEDAPLMSAEFDPLPHGAFDVPIESRHEDVHISRDVSQMPRKKNVEIRKMGRNSLSCHKKFSSARSGRKGKDFLAPISGGMGKAFFPPRSGGMGKAFLPPRSGGMGKAFLPPRSGGMGKVLLPPHYSSLTAEAENMSMEADACAQNNIDGDVVAYHGNEGVNQVRPDGGQCHLFSSQGSDKFQPEDKNKRRINCEKKVPQKNRNYALKEKQNSIQKKRVIQKQRDGTKGKGGARKGKARKKSMKLVTFVDNDHLESRELQNKVYDLSVGAEMDEIGSTFAECDEGLLARFPPATLRMKRPLAAHPWIDSKENLRNLFTVFRFLYTFADVINLCSFTLDEFVQAFHDHDSMLLGQIHIALLELLFEDIEYELKSSRTRKSTKTDFAVNDCGFLQLIQSVKCQRFDFKVRHKFLNPLTWPEILRQVVLEAGFGPKQKELQTENRIINKDESQIGPHGLVPGTLKHALFHILLREGTTGLKVSKLTKHIQNSDLNNISSSNGLEAAICSTLASDITLFEKISSSAFRLRANLIFTRDREQYHSCSESSDVESDYVESDSEKSDGDETGESGYEEQDRLNTTDCAREGVHGTGTQEIPPSMEGRNQLEALEDERNKGEGNDRLCDVGTATNESRVEEAWLLCLMEEEYEELSVEERLNALMTLVKIVKSGCSIQNSVKDPLETSSQFFLPVGPQRIGSQNGRHKTVAPKKYNKNDRSHNLSDLSGQKSHSKGLLASQKHGRGSSSMQCICLGSDRRHNTYWQFISRGSLQDQGRGRVYFQSSEDGHWEVIDNEEDLENFMLLLDSRSSREASLFASLRSCKAILCREMRKSKACRNQDISGNDSESNEREIMSSDSSAVSLVENNQNSIVSEAENDSSAPPGAISLEFGRTEMEKQHEWDRYRAFDKWVWSGFFQMLNVLKYNPDMLVSCEGCHDLYWPEEGHCKLCHTTFELDFDSEERYAVHVKTCRINTQNDSSHRHKVLPSRLQSLKAGMQAVEAVLPQEALEVSWKRSGQKVWIKRLRRASSSSELAQVLGDLETAIRDDWLQSCNLSFKSRSACREMMPIFAGAPHTIASMAFWLVRLDVIVSANQKKIPTKATCQRRLRSKGKNAI
ncbi:homeobox-DDT domain protein RLT3 isoform X2 [Cryptomeria japonica]|uniref:homeobox-DDT domain protein RLT3 isoform X2 n=1 Tax=Cryptomeria japonica TaxID=3369 RepID=UPI0025ABFDBA|nr:homeobox-DDT domain protein RLT3 isoform X2 [Cryptomeria japonica]